MTRHSNKEGVGNYQPLHNQPTNPQGQGLVGNAPLIGGLTNLPTPDGAGLVTGLVDIPHIEQLKELRARLNDGVAYCREHANDLYPQQYQRGVKRAVRLLTREYLPLLRELREAVSDDELRAHAEQLEARLNKGWAMETTPKRARLFERLLTEYEVMQDALDDDTTLRELGRITGEAA